MEDDEVSDSAVDPTFDSQPIGEYLRRQRILRGMTVEELSDLTRIPLRSLERLESGQFDGETDGFVRGFVRTVAQALGLDEEDSVARMLQEPSATAWEKHGPGRPAKQAFAIIVFLIFLGCGALGVHAIWNLLLGDASQPVSREVVLWRDPVRALAEATGEHVDPTEEIEPRRSPPPEKPRSAFRPAPVPVTEAGPAPSIADRAPPPPPRVVTRVRPSTVVPEPTPAALDPAAALDPPRALDPAAALDPPRALDPAAALDPPRAFE